MRLGNAKQSRQEKYVKGFRRVGLVCMFLGMFAGCGANVRPTPSIHRDLAPSLESISEFLDLIDVDDFFARFMNAEKHRVTVRFQGARDKSHLTGIQAQLRDEFYARAMTMVDEELTADRIRKVLTTTIQRSFTERDIDALVSFYGTKAGKAIVSQMRSGIGPYVENRPSSRDAIIEDLGRNPQNRGTRFLEAFELAAETHEISRIYGPDIDQDISSRLPAAQALFDAEAEPTLEEFQTRLRNLSIEYQTKIREAGGQ